MKLVYSLIQGCIALAVAMVPGAGTAGAALIAVATNFADAAETLAASFTTASGHEILISTGSSGSLFAQITHGAPFDIYLAADQHYPSAVATMGLGIKGTQFTYARGRLVLFTTSPNIDGATAVAVLQSAQFEKLAIANPTLAPYGRAAQQVLQNLQFWSVVSDKLVMGQNVGQAYAMVASGNAALGLVAQSSLHNDAVAGHFWPVPADLYAPIRQDAILLGTASTNPAALAFMEYLRSPAALDIIASYGYGVER